MKNKNDELAQRILTLIKLDASHLLERIRDRKTEYVEVFALRRTRDHFPLVFKSRYDEATIRDLSHCSTETISVLDQFYSMVDDLKWYLFVTEDMPNTVDDYVSRKIIRLTKLHEMIILYIDADLDVAINHPETLIKDENIDQSANNGGVSQKETYEIQGKEMSVNVCALMGRDRFAKAFYITFVRTDR